MNVEPAKQAITKFGRMVEKVSPVILAGIGIGSFVGCAFMAVKATPKAIELMDRKAREKYGEFLEPVSSI